MVKFPPGQPEEEEQRAAILGVSRTSEDPEGIALALFLTLTTAWRRRMVAEADSAHLGGRPAPVNVPPGLTGRYRSALVRLLQLLTHVEKLRRDTPQRPLANALRESQVLPLMLGHLDDGPTCYLRLICWGWFALCWLHDPDKFLGPSTPARADEVRFLYRLRQLMFNQWGHPFEDLPVGADVAGVWGLRPETHALTVLMPRALRERSMRVGAHSTQPPRWHANRAGRLLIEWNKMFYEDDKPEPSLSSMMAQMMAAGGISRSAAASTLFGVSFGSPSATPIPPFLMNQPLEELCDLSETHIHILRIAPIIETKQTILGAVVGDTIRTSDARHVWHANHVSDLSICCDDDTPTIVSVSSVDSLLIQHLNDGLRLDSPGFMDEYGHNVIVLVGEVTRQIYVDSRFRGRLVIGEMSQEIKGQLTGKLTAYDAEAPPSHLAKAVELLAPAPLALELYEAGFETILFPPVENGKREYSLGWLRNTWITLIAAHKLAKRSI